MTDTDTSSKGQRRFVLKYALLGLAFAILVLIGAAAYLIATFDPMHYHDVISRLVKDKTGRTLHITGGISLSVWPPVGLRIDRVSLTERGSEEAFASVEGARVQVEVLPFLLSHEIAASQLFLSGAKIRIVRYEDGRLNIDDLIGGERPVPQFDVRGIKVERSVLSYTDRAKKTTYELTDLTFDAPRLANTVQVPIELAFSARDANAQFLLRAKARGRLAMDVQAQRYALDAAVVEFDGSAPGISRATAVLKGDVLALLSANEIGASGLACSLTGQVFDQEFTVTLDASKLVVQAKQARGENLRAAVETRGTPGLTRLKMHSPSGTLEGDRVRTHDTAVEISSTRGEHHIRADLTASIEADIASRNLALADMRSTFNVSGPGLPRKGLAGSATGSARIDAAGEVVQLAITGAVDESKLQAQLKATGFAAPVYAFNVSIDKLDADRYLTEVTESRHKARSTAEATSLIEPLARLSATGTVTVGQLRSAGASARNVRFDMK
jgi:AsmA protein